MQVEKQIMLNSAIPSAAFDPSLADARIVAAGNGNPRAMESFADPSAHSLFFGKAVGVVRRDAPGAITLVAAAEQLETAKMVMQSPRPARK